MKKLLHIALISICIGSIQGCATWGIEPWTLALGYNSAATRQKGQPCTSNIYVLQNMAAPGKQLTFLEELLTHSNCLTCPGEQKQATCNPRHILVFLWCNCLGVSEGGSPGVLVSLFPGFYSHCGAQPFCPAVVGDQSPYYYTQYSPKILPVSFCAFG